ncbi:MAG: Flp pilus assembly complex ATPase component TadA [Planctomycetaceae bacterium]|nr:Flp pilus assembly complex ATPase component TadA [Planctomycetaceae bacterium]
MIDQILLRRGVLTPDQVTLAAEQANGRPVQDVAIEMGLTTEEAVLRALAEELDCEYVDLTNYEVDPTLISRFPTTAIFRHSVLPLERQNGHAVVAVSDPFNLEALDELTALSGLPLRPALALREDIVRLIKDSLGVGGDTINQLVARRQEDEVELLEDLSDEIGETAGEAQAPSVIRLVNELLVESIDQKSSDVHVEPTDTGLTIRFRVDGILRVQPVPPEINHFASAIITRLKIMSHLNIAEKRLPQDGRIKLRVHGRDIDVRVSIIPMVYGEGVVLRLLDRDRMVFNLNGAGMPPETRGQFEELISMPHGIMLVTGPTGSGKTTTLYSALNEIRSPTTKIITVEDPVEYHLEGLSQIQVHSRIGLTFAAGLRSILRHDPDVILIGEIRDGETAQSAIQASLTGHLVLSTLHTNDAPGAFTRLVDMNVEPYLVASTVEGVLAQRLTRVLCRHCREAYHPKPEELAPDFPVDLLTGELYRPRGCRNCRETGYTGRTGIYELLRNDATIRKLCTEHASSGQIRDYALRQGMITLRQAGWRKVIEGVTSVEEVLRITRGDAT